MADPENPEPPIPETENILTAAMANADAAKEGEHQEDDDPLISGVAKLAAAAVAETGTPSPTFNGHTKVLHQMLGVQADALLDRIYMIDAELARLLTERADAKAAYNEARGS